jgi:hypothetical protein
VYFFNNLLTHKTNQHHRKCFFSPTYLVLSMEMVMCKSYVRRHRILRFKSAKVSICNGTCFYHDTHSFVSIRRCMTYRTGAIIFGNTSINIGHKNFEFLEPNHNESG